MAKVLVYGAGAVGQFIGGLLTRTGKHEVTMIGRYDQYNAVQQGGMTLKRSEKDADFFRNPEFYVSTERIPRDTQFDWILFTLKAYDIPNALKELSHFINDKVRILLFQMGVGSEEMMLKVVPQERVFIATLTANVAIINAATVIETNKGGALCVAPALLRNSMMEVTSLLSGIDLEMLTFEDWKIMKWSALLYEMLFNGLCALADYKPETLVSKKELYPIEIEAFKEAVKVVEAIGIQPVDLPAYPIKKLILYSKLPAFIRDFLIKGLMFKKDSVKVPTVKNDMEKRRKGTEVAYLNGAVSKLGKKRRINTPHNDFVTDVLAQIVNGKKNWEIYKKQPEQIAADVELLRSHYKR